MTELADLKAKIKRYGNDMVKYADVKSPDDLNNIILTCRDLKQALNNVKKKDAEFQRIWGLVCDIEVYAENACEDQQVAGRLVHYKERLEKLKSLTVIFASVQNPEAAEAAPAV